MAVTFPGDLEIARRARLLPMAELAAGMGIDPGLIEPYGTDVAKIRL
jgi:formate--tetrahydrofolate ligase